MHPMRLWLLLAFACASATWALLLPLGTSADEAAHAVYAAAVTNGGTSHSRSLYVTVPARVADLGRKDCAHRRPAQTPVCAPALSRASGDTVVGTSAAGYPKLYYLAVGVPTLGNFSDFRWYMMRLLSVLLCTLFLAVGLWTVGRDRLPSAALAVLLACSPAVTAVVGAVNPSGPEIMAGLAAALATSGLVDALRVADLRKARWAAVAVGGMVAYLTVARPATWSVALGVLAVVSLFAADRLRPLAARKPSWVLGGFAAILAAMAVAQVLWGVIPRSVAKGVTVGWGKAISDDVLPNVGSRLIESVVRVADTDLASQVTSMFLLVLLVVVGAALWLGSAWQRLAILAGVSGTILVGPAFAFHSVFTTGSGYQARYALALFSATIVVSVATVAEHRLFWTTGRLASTGPLGWALFMLGTQISVFARYASGLPAPRSTLRVLLHHEWLPPAWPLVLLLIVAMLVSTERLSTTMNRMRLTRAPAPAAEGHARLTEPLAPRSDHPSSAWDSEKKEVNREH